MEQIIDARGWECPKPVIETKKRLDAVAEGEVVCIADNQIAAENLQNFAKSLGYLFKTMAKNGLFEVRITKPAAAADENRQGADGAPATKNGLVIQIASDTYGAESEGLGANLMRAYLYALTEVEPKPETLLFINRGVLLTTEGSPVLDSLQGLEESGTEIFSCGACLNFFQLSEKLKVGKITNMYEMVEKLNGAANSVKI